MPKARKTLATPCFLFCMDYNESNWF